MTKKLIDNMKLFIRTSVFLLFILMLFLSNNIITYAQSDKGAEISMLYDEEEIEEMDKESNKLHSGAIILGLIVGFYFAYQILDYESNKEK
jgi:hypothetical protein